jgi:hypothetical protein
MSNNTVSFGDRRTRVAALIPALAAVVMLAACGGGSPTTTTSGAKNRAFITNAFSGNVQIVDSQNDTTPMTQETTNSDCHIYHGYAGGREPGPHHDRSLRPQYLYHQFCH